LLSTFSSDVDSLIQLSFDDPMSLTIAVYFLCASIRSASILFIYLQTILECAEKAYRESQLEFLIDWR